MDIGNTRRDRFMDALASSFDTASRELDPSAPVGGGDGDTPSRRLHTAADRYARTLLHATLDPSDTPDGTADGDASVLSGLLLEAYDLGPRVEDATERDRRFIAARLADLGRRGITPRFGMNPDAMRAANAWIAAHPTPEGAPDPWNGVTRKAGAETTGHLHERIRRNAATRMAGTLDRRLRDLLARDGHAARLADMDRGHDPSEDPMVSLTRSARLFGTELAGDVQADEQPDYARLERDGETLGALVLEAYGLGPKVGDATAEERADMARALERVDEGLDGVDPDMMTRHREWSDTAVKAAPLPPDPWAGRDAFPQVDRPPLPDEHFQVLADAYKRYVDDPRLPVGQVYDRLTGGDPSRPVMEPARDDWTDMEIVRACNAYLERADSPGAQASRYGVPLVRTLRDRAFERARENGVRVAGPGSFGSLVIRGDEPSHAVRGGLPIDGWTERASNILDMAYDGGNRVADRNEFADAYLFMQDAATALADLEARGVVDVNPAPEPHGGVVVSKAGDEADGRSVRVRFARDAADAPEGTSVRLSLLRPEWGEEPIGRCPQHYRPDRGYIPDTDRLAERLLDGIGADRHAADTVTGQRAMAWLSTTELRLFGAAVTDAGNGRGPAGDEKALKLPTDDLIGLDRFRELIPGNPQQYRYIAMSPMVGDPKPADCAEAGERWNDLLHWAAEAEDALWEADATPERFGSAISTPARQALAPEGRTPLYPEGTTSHPLVDLGQYTPAGTTDAATVADAPARTQGATVDRTAFIRPERDVPTLLETWGGTVDDVMLSDRPMGIADRILDANGIDPVEQPELESQVADYITPAFSRLDGDLPAGSGTFAGLAVESHLEGAEYDARTPAYPTPYVDPGVNPADRAPDPASPMPTAPTPAPAAAGPSIA